MRKFEKLYEELMNERMDVITNAKEDILHFQKWRTNSEYADWDLVKTDPILQDDEYIYLLTRKGDRVALKGRKGKYVDYTKKFLKDIKQRSGMEHMGRTIMKQFR